MAPADRYFRQELAGEMTTACGFPVVAVLRSQGVVTEPTGSRALRRAAIIGVGRDFARLWNKEERATGFSMPEGEEAVISANTAAYLGVRPGDFLIVRVPQEGFARVNAPFVAGPSGTGGIRVKIRAIADDGAGGRFALENNQSAPYNVYLPLQLLAAKMGVTGFANTLLAASGEQPGATETLDRALQHTWTPADAGIVSSKPAPGLRQWTSRRIFVEDTLARAIAREKPASAGVLTYLVNSISLGERSTPYSFVAAVEPGIAAEDPRPGEIVIGDWLASDLEARPGDTVKLRYWTMGSGRALREQSEEFRISSVVPVIDDSAGRALMPDFPGIRHSGNCRDWETGTAVDLSKIRDKDEDYWKLYRGTPKAWIALADGQHIWKNPFGTVTAIRTRAGETAELPDPALRDLSPSLLGLAFMPVYQEGLRASAGSTDFGELFLGLGGLIVLAGLLLSGMLLSFYLRQRDSETELMRAIGFTNRRITWLLLPEVLAVTLAGGLLGVAAAMLYSRLVIAGLNTLWEEAVNTSSLSLFIRPETLAKGFLAGLLLNALLFTVILLRNRRRRRPLRYAQPGSRESHQSYRPRVMTYIRRSLLFRKVRMLTAITLLALGAFTILVTAINRRQGKHATDDPASGTGGFQLWMESALPVEPDLNIRAERAKAGIEEDTLLARCRFIPLPGIAGDDASCLNLNVVSKPGVLGVPAGYFDSKQAFSFVSLLPGLDPDHPWMGLLSSSGKGIIHGFADLTVLTWGLHRKVGDTLFYTDEQGRRLGIRIAGGLANSVFQGSLLVSDSILRLYFPSSARVNRLLIGSPKESAGTLARILEERLRDQGTVVVPAQERMAAFEGVSNTYLDVFILLGGLGVLLGTAGLAVLVMRSLHERKEERMLYPALGFPRTLIFRLVAGEYLVILFSGVLAGAVAAVAVNLPLIVHGGMHTIRYLLLLVVVLFANGILWIGWPVFLMIRKEKRR